MKKKVVTNTAYSKVGAEVVGGYSVEAQFDAHDTLVNADGSVKMPFHAVLKLVSTSELETVADRNPYGCVAESGGKAVVDSAKACECCADC